MRLSNGTIVLMTLTSLAGIVVSEDYESVVTQITLKHEEEDQCYPLAVGVYVRIQCTKPIDWKAQTADIGCKILQEVLRCNGILSDKIKTCNTARSSYFKTLLLLYDRVIHFVCGSDAAVLRGIFGPINEEEQDCTDVGMEQCLVRKGNICHVMLTTIHQDFYCVCTDKYELTSDRQKCELKDNQNEPPDLSALTYPPDAYPVDDFQAPRPNGSLVCGQTMLEAFRDTFEKAFFYQLPKPVKNGDYLCTVLPNNMESIMAFRVCNDGTFFQVKKVVETDASCFVHWESEFGDGFQDRIQPVYCKASYGSVSNAVALLVSLAILLANCIC